ncbi:MAG: hypothetical protein Q9167_002824 [Letrouitia subvulpina]
MSTLPPASTSHRLGDIANPLGPWKVGIEMANGIIPLARMESDNLGDWVIRVILIPVKANAPVPLLPSRDFGALVLAQVEPHPLGDFWLFTSDEGRPQEPNISVIERGTTHKTESRRARNNNTNIAKQPTATKAVSWAVVGQQMLDNKLFPPESAKENRDDMSPKLRAKMRYLRRKEEEASCREISGIFIVASAKQTRLPGATILHGNGQQQFGE